MTTIDLLKAKIMEASVMIDELKLKVEKLIEVKDEMTEFLMDIDAEHDIRLTLEEYGHYDKLKELINK